MILVLFTTEQYKISYSVSLHLDRRSATIITAVAFTKATNTSSYLS